MASPTGQYLRHPQFNHSVYIYLPSVSVFVTRYALYSCITTRNCWFMIINCYWRWFFIPRLLVSSHLGYSPRFVLVMASDVPEDVNEILSQMHNASITTSEDIRNTVFLSTADLSRGNER